MPSPEDYQRAAGGRRSSASGSRIGAGAVQAFTAMEIDGPVLRGLLGGGRMSAAGVSVNDRRALRNSGFFRAVKLVSTSIGMLPTHLHRRLPNGQTEKAKDHPLYRVLHKRPNSYQTAFEFKSFMQLCALLDGNAYARIVWGVKKGKPAVLALLPFARGTIEPNLTDAGEITFKYQPAKGGPRTFAARDVFHFRHPVTLDGLKGVSLLDMAVETLGLASVAERALAKMLSKGVMAGGAIEYPNELGDEAFKRLRESMNEDHAGAENAGDWFILEEGGKANPFTNAKDAQTDEMRKRQVEEIARFTDVPRPLLMLDETAWGSGIEQLGLFFVTYCLLGWFVAWEQAVERSCFTEAEQDADELYVKFNEGALLRGSLKDQADFYSKALGNNSAWMRANEVRANFELNPDPDGETLPKNTKAATPAKEPIDE
jgi:HK97 family phage portal protein